MKHTTAFYCHNFHKVAAGVDDSMDKAESS